MKKMYNKTAVLEDVNYMFNKGQLYPILGGNGCGRTTLFECICGDLAIDEGEIKTKEKSTIFLAAKQSILPMYVTGYEYIQFLCELNAHENEPEYYLEQVHMSEKSREEMICDYSFEDKKRLQLAAFLIQKPYIIMFDEPLDYCSEDYIKEFIEVLNTMKDEHIILISTGLLEIAQRISKDVVVLNNKELNMVSEDMMAMPEIKRAILDILEEADNEVI
jgi:ABC-2 type transport system ATP-binding protein